RNIPDNANLIISNIFGATVKKVKNKKSTEIIDISNLKAGVYFISNMERKNYFIKKIIKI
ncbi:MAG: T9SS type A sorting domain-containing protein, partial [Polaribacter sp.]